jgi:hypothetical protein
VYTGVVLPCHFPLSRCSSIFVTPATFTSIQLCYHQRRFRCCRELCGNWMWTPI